MKRSVIAAALVMVSCVIGMAQEPPGQAKKAPPPPGPASTITITVAGLSCTSGQHTFSASSYTFGATLEGAVPGGGGGGAGRATVTPLNVVKKLDQCSPKLFAAVVQGRHFARLDLVQKDADGNTVLTIKLEDVLVTQYQIGGAEDSPSPVESLAFIYREICITEPNSGTTFCYDSGART